jgi:hypothetical protein
MIRTQAQKYGVGLASAFDKLVRDTLAISYLRLGEQENCLHYHGQDSCLYPIKGEASTWNGEEPRARSVN